MNLIKQKNFNVTPLNPLLFLTIFLLVLFGLNPQKITAQAPFLCNTPETLGENKTLPPETPLKDCFLEKYCDGGDISLELPIATIKVNFHFIATNNGNLAPDDPNDSSDDYSLLNGNYSATRIVGEANKRLSGLIDDGVVLRPFIGDSRLRFQIYTEPSNSDDLFGGVWFWNNMAEFNQSNLDLYQGEVLNVVIRNDTPTDCTGNGFACGLGNLCDRVTLEDYFNKVTNCGDTWPYPLYGIMLTHEFIHTAGLCHSFSGASTSSSASCANEDLDAVAECNNNGNVGATCGTAGGCAAWTSGSQNIMGYNGSGRTLSCCQWRTIWESILNIQPNHIEFPENLYTNLTISNGQDVTIVGYSEADEITIEQGGKLTIRGNMKITDKITVEPGGELRLECALLTNRTENIKWEGIIVKGDPSQHQWKIGGQRFQGYVYSTDSRIQNAIYAVRLYNPAQSPVHSGTGGILLATNTEFYNNGQSVGIHDYQNFNPFTGQPQGNFTAFNQCKFDIDNNFIGNYLNEFRRHAYLIRVTGIRFHGCEFYNNYTGLTFAAEKRNGIESRDADFFVGAVCVDGNPSTEPCQNYKSTVFEGLGYGINAYNFSSTNTFRVVRSEFNDNFVGISAGAVDNVYAVKNSFRVGMSLTPQYSYYAGIQLFNSTGFQVEDNDFAQSSQVEDNAITIGSAVRGARQEANEIYRNRYHNLMYGNLSNGDNRNNFNAQIGLQYRCNENSTNDYDFGIHELSSIAENQGSTVESAGNCFSNNPLITESDIRNEAESINYFFDTNCPPLDVSSNVLTQVSPANDCSSGIPGDERGRLSEKEKDFYKQNLTNAVIAKQTTSSNRLIRNYLINEESYEWSAARTLLKGKNSLQAYMKIIDSYLYEKNTDMAQQTLIHIEKEMIHSDEKKETFQLFARLKEMQIEAVKHNIPYSVMAQKNANELLNLAKSDDSYVATQAQGVYNTFIEQKFTPILEIPDLVQSRELVTPNVGNVNSAENKVFLTVAPNPANNFTFFTYQLPEKIENGVLTIRNINGQLLKSIPLLSNSGRISLDIEQFSNGIYLYSLIVEEKIMVTQRLVVTKN